MRPSLSFCLPVALLAAWATVPAAAQATRIRFRITESGASKIILVESASDSVDLYTLKKYFHKPYHLPDKFIDPRFKSQTITTWHHPESQDFKQNWSNSYVYDSLSRLTSYSYSSCFICSQFAYHFQVTYNARNQVVRLENTMNNPSRWQIRYNRRGELLEMAYYSFGRLEHTIRRVR